MDGFKTPIRKKLRPSDDVNLQTPIKIPASPFLQQIGFGCGVQVFTLERSPKVGFVRSPWAIKKRNSKNTKGKELDNRIRLEAEILQKLSHPNIVGFRAFTLTSKGEPCLAMEQLDYSLGDMIEDKLDKADDIFPAKDILHIGNEIAKGLEYLHHTVYILHGDVKSYNILVSKDLKQVKLCDFGVSIPLTETLEIDNSKGDFVYIGTKCWSAPEVILEEGPITNKCDIWAYGLVLWEMMALSPPHIKEDESLNTDDESSTSQGHISVKNISDDSDIGLDESITFLKKVRNTYGCRPPLPAIDLGVDYTEVLDIFYTCTIADYNLRPSAKGLVMYFKKVLPLM